jgi:aspartyl-tRNA synthetase
VWIKFYSAEDLKKWADLTKAAPGDILFILCGEEEKTRKTTG